MTGFSPTRVIGGRYVVLGDLGRGGIGAVWRAADRVTGRQVAVAELHLPGGRDSDERRLVRERVLRAARAAGRLDHPGLVAAYDVVTEGEVDYIVTELVDAPTLADRVATGGTLDERAAGAMARQLAATLHAVHSAGVVHGDVSPRTILLPSDGRVRLTCVGIAEAVDPLRTTRASEFLAPELRDGGPATPESDLWALGAALHVALLGRPPSGDVAPEGAVGGALGGVLAELLQRAPQDRPTARQVTSALEATGTLAGPAAEGRSRWWWAAAGAVLGLLVGLAAGFGLAGPRVPTLTYGPGGDVALAGPAAGACLAAAPAPGAVATAVDCGGPHAAEVVATLDPYGERDVPYPGRDALDRFAAGACTVAFEAVVEASHRAGLDLTALVPAQAAFGAGEHDVHCLVRASDGSTLTGTIVAGKQG
jgi:eukaryotic-like serine/threonine-protein kinase